LSGSAKIIVTHTNQPQEQSRHVALRTPMVIKDDGGGTYRFRETRAI
jgi:hypothetical protein